jgi:hypothetical protein
VRVCGQTRRIHAHTRPASDSLSLAHASTRRARVLPNPMHARHRQAQRLNPPSHANVCITEAWLACEWPNPLCACAPKQNQLVHHPQRGPRPPLARRHRAVASLAEARRLSGADSDTRCCRRYHRCCLRDERCCLRYGTTSAGPRGSPRAAFKATRAQARSITMPTGWDIETSPASPTRQCTTALHTHDASANMRTRTHHARTRRSKHENTLPCACVHCARMGRSSKR